ncbi:hypothetical protein [Streptosporangium sp. OZ121]|uniref:hypothetical protein n=1 Tax=Streptosporangium sp. OZ121 TaxID=3444183 RepID=UPI003F7993C0
MAAGVRGETRGAAAVAADVRDETRGAAAVAADVRDETRGAAAVAAVAFLASPDAAHATGAGPVVDGGRTAVKASA